ncbi:chemotaxis protein CheW [Chungangia koreensis]|uniref:Chemotaxis protein CheW n=1 Tax=Chungangia koreensis TaxID=752657 RepID=A0ABV8X518_9LACT
MELGNKYIIFQLGEQLYGATIDQVRSIEKIMDVTSLPGTPNYLMGVADLRGIITPVIDMKKLLQIPGIIETDEAKILIVHIGENQFGLVVDVATDVINIESDFIKASPNVVGEANRALISGLAQLQDKIITLLDIDHLLSTNDLDELNEL